MNREELAHLFSSYGFELTPKQVDEFHTYLEELLKWNKVHNLTSVRDERDIVIRHFLDSLTLARCLEELSINWEGKDVADVGTGAGFPGVPLKIYLTDFKLYLIESVAKKCSFLELLKVKLSYEWRVICERAEKVEGKFDIVVSRAMGEFDKIHKILERLSSGYVLVMKGESLKEEWITSMGYKVYRVGIEGLPPSNILWKRVK